MIGRLDDPWFGATFIGNTTAAGHHMDVPFQEADGVFFWCPCGFGKPAYPLDGPRPHGVIVSFANPPSGRPVPANAGSRSRSGGPSRWTVSGTSLADLTLSPSVDVGNPSCWHGFVEKGVVR